MSDDEDRQVANIEEIAKGFDATYAAVRHSPTLRRIWREVYADDYPAEADPFSAVTLTDLRRIARELAVAPGQTFADLACGTGGPGLWVARETGASLVGVDLSRVAIGQAHERAEAWDMAERATFRVGEATATGLESASLAAVMSIDAFWLFPDKPAAVAEVARILQPGGASSSRRGSAGSRRRAGRPSWPITMRCWGKPASWWRRMRRHPTGSAGSER